METNNKLREALKLCVDEMCNRCRELAAARGDTMPCLSGCEPVRKAKAALAAPPRNCDKYVSLDEARNAYMVINEMPEGNRDEDMRRWLCDFHNWLFAPATEKEGEE